MTAEESTSFIQARFIAKESSELNIPDVPLSIVSTSNRDHLRQILNQILSERSDDSQRWQYRNFDFLINDKLLRTELHEHLAENVISTEAVLEIECILPSDAPTPGPSIAHQDWVSAVAVSSQCFLSGCYDGSISVFAFDGADRLLVIPAHPGQPIKCLKLIASIAEHSAVQFLSGSHDQTLILWQLNLKPKPIVEPLMIFRGHERSVEAVDANTDGTRFVSGGFDTLLKVWSTEKNVASEMHTERKRVKHDEESQVQTKTPMVTLSGHKEAITGISWVDRADVITSSLDHTLRIWDLEMCGQKQQLAGNKAFLCCSYSNASIVTGSSDSTVRLWDTRSKGALVKSVFHGHSGWISSVKWSPHNQNHFVSGSYDHKLKIWDLRSTKASLYDLSAHIDRVLCVDWSDGVILSGSVDTQMNVFCYQ